MSAAESLSVGSVASIASQDGGLSQTSAALSIYGPFGQPAALSTTQPSVVSNAIETELSGIHEDDGHDHTSSTPTGAQQFGDEGGLRFRLRSNRRRNLEMGTAILTPDASKQVSPVAGSGLQGMDSTMAVMLSSVGNDGGSSVGQILHEESPAEEHSVNKAKARRTARTCRMSTRLMKRRLHSASLGVNPPNSQPQPDALCEPNGSLCSLGQSNSVHSRNSANEIEEDVQSNTDGNASAAFRRHASHNLTDIPMAHERSGSAASVMRDCPHRGHSWPLIETEGMSMDDTVNREGSGGYLVYEMNQTSTGPEPADSIPETEGSVHGIPRSLVESNEAVESSPTGQGSLSVHQPMNVETEEDPYNDDHFGVKRKDKSFDGSSSGKRRH